MLKKVVATYLATDPQGKGGFCVIITFGVINKVHKKFSRDVFLFVAEKT